MSTLSRDVPSPRRKRRLLRLLAVFALIIIVLVALAPTLLSFGIAARIARNAIADAVQGDVALRSVRLGWLSGQKIEGLSIRDAGGRNTIDVDVQVDTGLLTLLRGGTVRATLTGRAAGTIDAEGNIGLAALFATPESETERAAPTDAPAPAPAPTSAGPSGVPAGLHVELALDRFSLSLEDLAEGETYTLKDLSGPVLIDGATGRVSTDLRAVTEFLGAQGQVTLKAGLNNVGGATLDLGKVGLDLALDAGNLRVPAGERRADFSSVVLSVTSPGLDQSLTINATAEGRVDGATPSSMRAALVIGAPIVAGAVSIDPERVQGSIEAANLPTSLAQPFLVRTDVILSEDLGPAIERLSLQAPGGGAEAMSFDLVTERVKLSGRAQMRHGAGITVGSFEGSLEVSPATAERLGDAKIDSPARFALRGRNLSWSAPAPGAQPWSDFTGTIELAPEAGFTWRNDDYAAAIGASEGLRIVRADAKGSFAVEAAFAIGLVASDAPPVAPSTPNLTAKASIDADLTRLTRGTLEYDALLQPACLAALTDRTFTDPLPLRIAVTKFESALPPAGAEDISINARIEVPGEQSLYVKELEREVRFGDIVAVIEGEDPAKEVILDVKGRAEGGSLALHQTLRGLPKEWEGIDPFELDLRGSADVLKLDGAALVAWAPAYRELIEAAGVKGLSLSLRNEPAAGGAAQRVSVTLGGEPVQGEVAAVVGRAEATVERLSLTGAIGRQLLAAMQSDRPEGEKIKLAKDAPFTASLPTPTRFVYEQLAEGELPAGLAAQLALPDLVVWQAPWIESPVALSDFAALIAAPSAGEVSVKGSLSAAGTTSPNDRIERAEFDLLRRTPGEQSLLSGVTGTIALTGVNVPWVELVLGQPKGRLSTWTGDDGTLTLALSESGGRETIRIDPVFPRFTGVIDVTAQGEGFVARASNINTRVRAVEMREFVNPPHAEPGSSRYDFANFLAVRIDSLVIDAPAGLRSEGWSLAGAKLEGALETDPVGVAIIAGPGTGKRLSIPGVTAQLSAPKLDDGLAFSVRGRNPAAGDPVIAVQGNVHRPLDAAGQLDLDAATFGLDADVRNLPTIVLDLLAATGGTIARSLGETIDLTAKARNASHSDGELSLSAKTPFADLAAPAVLLKEGVVTITPAAPLTASFGLSPGVRDELLYLINPLFADVSIVKRRATFALPNLAYPLDGDMSRSNADLSLDIGDVTFRRGQPFSAVLALLRDRSPSEDLEGVILPLSVQVRSGILRYENFGVRLGRIPAAAPGAQPTWRTSLDFKGEIDLTRDPPYVTGITTSMPASQIGSFSGDARRFFDSIGGPDGELAKVLSIGITLSGPLFNPDGGFATLEQRVTLPTVEDIAKDPSRLLDGGLKIFEQFQRDRKK